MSIRNVHAFREAVNASADLQVEIRQAGGGLDLVALAAQHGYAFTEHELQQAIEDSGDVQLSEFELEMVAGGIGGNAGC